MVILLGIRNGDTEKEASYLAKKCANLRVFENQAGKLDLSLTDISGEALVISNFTLYGDCQKGRRPDFTNTAKQDIANDLYLMFINELKKEGIPVASGEFGEKMELCLINDGPITLILER